MTNGSPLTIALIDDDYIFQLTASRMLKSADPDLTILQFSNGEEALRYLHTNSKEADKLPTTILLDINMPHIDGWMFLNEYAQLQKDICQPINIYMVSSSIDPMDISRAKNNAFVKDYLLKPISREGFKELVLNESKKAI